VGKNERVLVCAQRELNAILWIERERKREREREKKKEE
jgi:hypothetical protein